MQSIKDSVFHSEVLKEMNYHFGTFYYFDGFIVSEIKGGIDFSWDYAKIVIAHVIEYYGSDGSDIVYISNRINKYNVKPVDWFKFTFYAYKLQGYGIIAKTDTERRNAKFESIFIPSRFKTFNDVFEAMQWAAELAEKHRRESMNN